MTVTPFTSMNFEQGAVSFWIYPFSIVQGVSPEYQAILNVTGPTQRQPFRITLGEDRQNFLGLHDSSFGFYPINSGIPISSMYNRWHHVLYTWNRNNLDVYLDAKRIARVNNFYAGSGSFDPPIAENYDHLFIGGSGNSGLGGGGDHPETIIDELRIYAESLQEAQVKKLYAEANVRH